MSLETQLRQEMAVLHARVDRLDRKLGELLGATRVTVLPDGTMCREEAAKMLGLAASTLNRMASRREGPPFKVFRGKAFYRREDLETWRQEQTRLGASQKPQRRAATAPAVACLFGDEAASA